MELIEKWKKIKGFEKVYSISSFGRLKSFKKQKEGYILSNKNSKKGYLSVVLKNKNKVKYTRIHRLVAEHFIPNPLNKTQVNHKDLDKQNNNVSNLEWCTPRENMKHSVKNNPNCVKAMIYKNQHIRPKTIIQKSLNGEYIESFYNSTMASKKTGVCGRNILQVANKDEYKPGKIRKQAGGFIWEFED